jgi:transcriptional regulator with GAF, ATPase, and Fis domain
VIIGASPAIRRALALAERYARTHLPMLLVGATGTGKELFAQHIHERSGRPGPLVDVNCCALPRDMVESLLFGHRRGAFTGAVESTVGHIERSDGGTLFLDEFTSLLPEAQGKLLRVLEKSEVQPVGAAHKRRVDLRVVSAAQEDVWAAVNAGRLRSDLYQRVAGVVIELPPLGARPEDIVPLARHFASQQGKRLEAGVEGTLLAYSWPGNVRELRMVIERAAELVTDGMLPRSTIREAIELGTPSVRVVGLLPTKDSGLWRDDPLATVTPALVARDTTGVTGGDQGRADGHERARLVEACRAGGFHGERAAAIYGVSRATFFNRLRSQGLSLRVLRSLTESKTLD